VSSVYGTSWFPGLVSQSVLRDAFPCRISSLERQRQQKIIVRGQLGKDVMASEWQSLLDQGQVKNRAELARRMGVTRARVTQVLGAEKTN